VLKQCAVSVAIGANWSHSRRDWDWLALRETQRHSKTLGTHVWNAFLSAAADPPQVPQVRFSPFSLRAIQFISGDRRLRRRLIHGSACVCDSSDLPRGFSRAPSAPSTSPVANCTQQKRSPVSRLCSWITLFAVRAAVLMFSHRHRIAMHLP